MDHCHDMNPVIVRHMTDSPKVSYEQVLKENLLLHPSPDFSEIMIPALYAPYFTIGNYVDNHNLALWLDTLEGSNDPFHTSMHHLLPDQFLLGPTPPIALTSYNNEDGPNSGLDVDSGSLSDVSDITDLSISDIDEEDLIDMDALFDDTQTFWHSQNTDMDESVPFLLQEADQVFNYSNTYEGVENATYDPFDSANYLLPIDAFMSYSTEDDTGLKLPSSVIWCPWEI